MATARVKDGNRLITMRDGRRRVHRSGTVITDLTDAEAKVYTGQGLLDAPPEQPAEEKAPPKAPATK